MPYDFDWLDEDRRVAALRLYDPFHDDQRLALEQEITNVLAVGEPLYLLIDIREFNALQAFSRFAATNSGAQIPSMSDRQMEHSRLAVIGGSAMVKMMFRLIKGSDEHSNKIRTFKHEDRAFSWLNEQARGMQSA